jgi:hypothetical protein
MRLLIVQLMVRLGCRIARLLGQEIIYHIYPTKKVEALEDYIEKEINK